VPDLAEVVELGTGSDYGFADDGAVHAGSGTQFNAVTNAHAAEVRNLGPSRRTRVGRYKSESVGTQYHIGVKHAVGSDDGSGIQNDARVEYAARPDLDVFGELNTVSKNRTWVDAFGPRCSPSYMALATCEDHCPCRIGVCYPNDAPAKSFWSFRIRTCEDYRST
jgi:hypothetical protein